jgi:hypothetical protein
VGTWAYTIHIIWHRFFSTLSVEFVAQEGHDPPVSVGWDVRPVPINEWLEIDWEHPTGRTPDNAGGRVKIWI